MSGKSFWKDPDSVLPFGIDWTLWAAQEDDTITDAIWEIVGEGADPPIEGILQRGAESLVESLATVWLEAGTAGTTYEVRNRVYTAGGRQDDRTIRVRVQER